MAIPELEKFALVGGTNLALRFGHRLSIDLDLFTNEEFDPNTLFDAILKVFPNTEQAGIRKTMLFMYINDIKVDIVLIPYPYLQPIEDIEGIRMVSVPDIISMKLHAVSTRGVKKDFWDIAELLNYYTLTEMVQFFKAKYSNHDIWHILRSLIYFQDAEQQTKDPDPLKKVTWKEVKKKIQVTVKQYINSTVEE
jgi:hypothetical protein